MITPGELDRMEQQASTPGVFLLIAEIRKLHAICRQATFIDLDESHEQMTVDLLVLVERIKEEVFGE